MSFEFQKRSVHRKISISIVPAYLELNSNCRLKSFHREKMEEKEEERNWIGLIFSAVDDQ